MGFSLKPHQLVAHWVPGVVVIAILFLADLKNEFHLFKHVTDALGAPVTVLALAVMAFAIGLFLDDIRNLAEEFTGRFCPKYTIKWDFIWKFSKENLQRLEDYYFTYYVFDFNMACALFISLLAVEFLPIFPQHLPCWILVIIGIATFVFALDCHFLRKEIIKLSNHPPASKNETP